MKELLLATLLLATTSTLANQGNIVKEGYFVNDSKRDFLKTIHAQKRFTVDHPNKRGYEVYGPKDLGKWLKENSPFSFSSLRLEEKEKSLATYPTPEEIELKLKKLAKDNPNIFKLFSIGKTERGRELWMMKVSDNVEVDEVEPEFKYVANMHGDEIVGREMMVSLLEELAKNYKSSDLETTTLINNTEIYIMPSLNPDGAASRRRGNSNWRDLNRDFPDVVRDGQIEDTHSHSIFDNESRDRQNETVAMMNFQKKRHFALSANFHGGTEVVNYPWDTTGDDFPYKDLVVELSREYAVKIPSMRDNWEFVDGIVNGYQWYEINGGMQDWSYHWHNDLQVTIELSHSKWPTYDLVQSYYDKNRDSLFDYMKSIHQGFGIKFTKDEKFKVEIFKKNESSLTKIDTISKNGREFYKVLAAGNYKVKVTTSKLKKEIDLEVKKNSISPNGNYISL